jgi:hypothetical protein
MQTEAFLEFKAQYPEIEIKQRKFESLNLSLCVLQGKGTEDPASAGNMWRLK